MKNDEVFKPAFLRHSTFLVHYSIFLFGSGLSGKLQIMRVNCFLLTAAFGIPQEHPGKVCDYSNSSNSRGNKGIYFTQYIPLES